jgi:hypothetical protein
MSAVARGFTSRLEYDYGRGTVFFRVCRLALIRVFAALTLLSCGEDPD